MAQVTIVIEDEEDGGVGVRMEFNPPAKPGEPTTPAHEAAFKALSAMQDASAEWDEIVDDGWETPDDEV